MSYNIRKINKNDFYKKYLDLLSELSIVEDTYYEVFSENIENINKNINHFIFVIEIDNIIIGSITVLIEQKIIRNFSKVLHIEDLVVKKEYRKKNIAKKLINYCINFAKKNKCYKIILNCENKFKIFYEKLGFNNKNLEMSIYFNN